MSVAQFVDFKRTRKGGRSEPGGWRGVTYNALLREGRPRITIIFESSVRTKTISQRMRLTKKDL